MVGARLPPAAPRIMAIYVCYRVCAFSFGCTTMATKDTFSPKRAKTILPKAREMKLSCMRFGDISESLFFSFWRIVQFRSPSDK